jgi:uncharacterized protein (TIGR00251 family)
MLLQVKVKPNARASTLERLDDGTWLAQVRSPPVDGDANAELIKLVAQHFKCRRADVTIKSGAAARKKVLKIDTAD